MKKTCKTCNKTFNYNGHNQKYCSSECLKKYIKECSKVYRLKYNNSEKGKQIRKDFSEEYRKTSKYKDYQKNYYSIYEHIKKRKEYGKIYRQTEHAKILARFKSSKRRSKLREVIHEDYKDWLKKILSYKFYICHWCGEKFSIDKLTLDHLIPISKGGPDTKDNLVPCCMECNRKKHAKLPEEFNSTLDQPRLFI